MKKVVIIGGGVSGMFSALMIRKKYLSVPITILEMNSRLGKKLLATGGGKCNIGNCTLDEKKYNHPKFASVVIKQVPLDDYIETLLSFGIITKSDSEGRLYPYSEAASTVLNVLLENLKKSSIEIKTNFEVVEILKKDEYIIRGRGNCEERASHIVISCGSNASSSASLLHNNFNSRKYFNPLKPALVGLKVKESLSDLQGIRVKALVKLIRNEEEVFNQLGEVQFKSDGLSGIVVMNASRYYDESYRNKIVLDLAPNYSLEQLDQLFKKIPNKSVKEILLGMFPKMLALRIAKSPNCLKAIKNFAFNIDKPYPIDTAQVARGGFDITQIDPNSFKFKNEPTLFVCGEIVDIDGECGGYNLYFAIASAIILGRNICL